MSRQPTPGMIAWYWGVTGALFGAKLMGANIPWWVVFFLPISTLGVIAAIIIGAAIVAIFSKGK